MLVWHFDSQSYVTLLPWMRWCGYIMTPILTEDEWDVILKASVTEEEWTEILVQREKQRLARENKLKKLKK